jgi:hypothetical protein
MIEPQAIDAALLSTGQRMVAGLEFRSLGSSSVVIGPRPSLHSLLQPKRSARSLLTKRPSLLFPWGVMNPLPRRNLRPRPQGGGGDTGAVAKLIHELKYQARRAERSEARPDGHEQLGTTQ